MLVSDFSFMYIHLVAAPLLLRFHLLGHNPWLESRVNHVKGLGSSDSSSEEDSEDDVAGGPDHVNPLLLDPTQWKVS